MAISCGGGRDEVPRGTKDPGMLPQSKHPERRPRPKASDPEGSGLRHDSRKARGFSSSLLPDARISPLRGRDSHAERVPSNLILRTPQPEACLASGARPRANSARASAPLPKGQSHRHHTRRCRLERQGRMPEGIAISACTPHVSLNSFQGGLNCQTGTRVEGVPDREYCLQSSLGGTYDPEC